MTAFNAASLVEARGMQVLLPWLEEKSYGGKRLVLTAKGALARKLQLEVGDILINIGPSTVWALELKIEQEHTGNLFLETWSNRNLETVQGHAQYGSNPGWMMHSRADLLLYYFLDTDDLYALPMFKLKRWAFRIDDDWPGIYRFKERPQGRYSQANDTWGRVVPVAALLRDRVCKQFKVRQLSFCDMEEEFGF
jgi:hypothetical protein